ncbi:MAG TPA: ATP synthase F0 subunit C [Candidatus Aquilonibacter sp.]|nr:ATP synthase F0 subunit C [Candidatus Aquilonibacter sp.]
MTKKAAWILLAFALMLILAPVTFAQGAGTAAATGSYDWIDLAAALALGIAAAGGGLGQGRATAAACESTARNPGAAGPIRNAFIIGVALIESLVLYVLVIVFIK